MNRIQISSTIKPSNENFVKLRRLLDVGTDIIRIPFWIQNEAQMLKNITEIKSYNSANNTHIKILFDVPGNKIRFGTFYSDPAIFELGRTYYLFKGIRSERADYLPVESDLFFNVCEVGDKLVCGDGDTVLDVLERTGSVVAVVAPYPSRIQSKKGICICNKDVNLSARNAFLVDHCVSLSSEHSLDWLALSFAASAEDVSVVKQKLVANGNFYTKVMAKIESQEGLTNLDSILEASDGIMVARGDLGAYVDFAKLGLYQKEIVKKCKDRKRFCMVSTGIITSLLEKARPRSAEVLDITNIVIDGADALQFCEETANNEDPSYVVKITREIIDVVYKHTLYEEGLNFV